MPKKVLGSGGKHRANSPTSRLARRCAEALDHRRPLRRRCGSTSARRTITFRSLESVAPTREVRQAALELELQRLDQLQAAVSAAAAKGDTDAIKATLFDHAHARALEKDIGKLLSVVVEDD